MIECGGPRGGVLKDEGAATREEGDTNRLSAGAGHRNLVTMVLSMLLSGSPSVSAETPCELVPGNLLAHHDCGFENGHAEWQPADEETTRIEQQTLAGGSSTGALRALGVDGSVVVLGPCLAASGGVEYRASMRVAAVAGTVFYCGITGREYTDPDCQEGREVLELSVSATPLGPDQVDGEAGLGRPAECEREPCAAVEQPEPAVERPPPILRWQNPSGSGTTAAGVRSVRLHLECNGEPGFEVVFDELVLSPR